MIQPDPDMLGWVGWEISQPDEVELGWKIWNPSDPTKPMHTLPETCRHPLWFPLNFDGFEEVLFLSSAILLFTLISVKVYMGYHCFLGWHGTLEKDCANLNLPLSINLKYWYIPCGIDILKYTWDIGETIYVYSAFAGYGQAHEYIGKAAFRDTFCENQCWEKSILGGEAQDHCSSNPCPHKECQSGWLCGMLEEYIHTIYRTHIYILIWIFWW